MYKDIVFLDGIHKDYLQQIQSFLKEWDSQLPVIPVKTSGSTGQPKTIQLDKDKMIASAKATGKFFNFQKGQALLMNLSPEHVAGKMMMVRAIVHEMKIVVAPLAANPLEGLEEFPVKINFGGFVPYQVENILKNERSKKLYNSIPKVIIGGAAINHILEHQIQDCTNENFATFGMTETITHFALRNINEGEEFYRCLPDVKIGVDERSCLVIKESPVTKYELVTNDIVELVSDSQFIWKGRYDNTINSGGVKIHPETDERIIEYMIPDRRFYFSSREHDQLGEEVVLVIEGQPMDSKEETLLLNKILQTLPNYHAPRDVKYLEEFKETENGKIIRKRIS